MPSLAQIIEDQQKFILELYLKEIPESESKKLAEFLPDNLPKNQTELKAKVEEFLKLPQETKLNIGEHLARIADIQTRVRNAINSKFAADFADNTPMDAYAFRHTIQEFANKNLPKEVVEEILGQSIISNSITAHPTNPYSTAYTIESMNLDRILSEENSDEKSELVRQQIKKMIAIQPTSSVTEKNKGKKTQEDEVKEAMSYMNNIYNSLPAARRDMEKVLKEHPNLGYDQIKIGKFYEMGAWLTGDGDGNPNATAESLQMNISTFNREIIRLYSEDLKAIRASISDEILQNRIDQILTALPPYKEPANFIGHLQLLEKEFGEKGFAKEKIEDLIYRAENFGFHYAKIDIRHDASDINIAVCEILFALKIFDEKTKNEFLEKLQNGQDIQKCSADLSRYLNDLKQSPEEIFEALKERFNSASEKDKKSLETTLRIFGRLNVVAQNPGSSEKLIIAECKNGANALGAMLLLKASGNKINQKGSLNIVTLSESADDLIALPENIRALLTNETYRRHVVENGKFYYMIAKSDTQRRDGVGAQFAQELPPEQVTALFAELTHEYPELKNVKLIPFNGGGHALQRGGGRIDEIPNVYAKAAGRGLHWLAESDDITILPPVLTTQGHQNGILFSAINAGNFLMSYFSQGVYAESKMRGLLPEPEVLKDGEINEEAQEARANRQIFFEKSRAVYQEEIITYNSPINVLFRNGPWAGVDLTNVSSRPSKRAETTKDLQLTDQRAIGAEKMCAHSGTHLISWYSASAGLQAIIDEKGLDAATSMFANDKSTRDTFRSMAMSLFMTDFDISWNMMIGQTRPDISTIKSLAQDYGNEAFKTKTPEEQNQITLAHIEVEAIKTAQLIYKIIVNDKELSDDAPHKLLKELWPNLATEIENREAKLKFSHMVEAALMNSLPQDKKRYPDDPEMESLMRVFNTACSGEGTPTSPMLTSTKQVGKIDSVDLSNVDEGLKKKLLVTGISSPNTSFIKIDSLGLAPKTPELMVI